MCERLGLEPGMLPEEGGQTLFRGVRNHHEKHYACVLEGESVNWWVGGGGITEGQKYTVYPCDSIGDPYSDHPEGIFVHLHRRGFATVEQLHKKAQALGHTVPGAVIITDPPRDEKGTIGYLVKVAEAPRPAWETETWGIDDRQEEQGVADDFFRFLGRRGPGATSI